MYLFPTNKPIIMSNKTYCYYQNLSNKSICRDNDTTNKRLVKMFYITGKSNTINNINNINDIQDFYTLEDLHLWIFKTPISVLLILYNTLNHLVYYQL